MPEILFSIDQGAGAHDGCVTRFEAGRQHLNLISEDGQKMGFKALPDGLEQQFSGCCRATKKENSFREEFISGLLMEPSVNSVKYTSSDTLSIRSIFKGLGAELILIDSK